MNINEDHIIDYLEGSLLPSDLQLFEEELKVNSALKEAVHAQQLVNEALSFNQDEDLKATLKLWDNADNKEDNISAKSFRLNPKWMAMAASLIVILAAVFLLTRPTETDRLFASNYIEPLAGISRDVNNQAVSELYVDALKHYAANDYSRALDGFQGVNLDDPFFEESVLLKIDCLIKLKDWHAAQVATNNGLLHTKVSRLFIERLEWTNILLHIKKNELDDATELNDQVISNPNHLFRSKAIALKKKLDAL